MTEWVKDKTKYRGEVEPSRTNLLSNKNVDLGKDVRYTSYLEKSNHITMEIGVMGGIEKGQGENHKIGGIMHGQILLILKDEL